MSFLPFLALRDMDPLKYILLVVEGEEQDVLVARSIFRRNDLDTHTPFDTLGHFLLDPFSFSS